MIREVYLVTFSILAAFIGIQEATHIGSCTKEKYEKCLVYEDILHRELYFVDMEDLDITVRHKLQSCISRFSSFFKMIGEFTMFETCCDGYAVDKNNVCKPICMPNCAHGTCVAPNECSCFTGFRGRTCNSTCSVNRWGQDCKSDCQCRNGGKCDPVDGTCQCGKGWIGTHCEEPCPEGYYGYFCEEECRCENSATCDHINGRCRCTTGYWGPLCSDKCPEGFHGHQCKDECKCQNNATCHHEDGSCECTPGWIGEICTERCDDWHFGDNCSGICHCFNKGTCDFVTGQCTCTARFYGENCEMECPLGTWGLNCTQECYCANGECNVLDGSCSCFPGFSGKKCDVRACPDNMWGENCTNECNCEQGMECHPITGECWPSLEPMRNCTLKRKGGSEKLVQEEDVDIWMIAFAVSNSLMFFILIVMAIAYHRKVLSTHGIENESLFSWYSKLVKEDNLQEDTIASSRSSTR